MQKVDHDKIVSYTRDGKELYGMTALLNYIGTRWQGTFLDTDHGLPISTFINDKDRSFWIMKPPVYSRDDSVPVFEQVLKTDLELSIFCNGLGFKERWDLFNLLLKAKEKEHYTNLKTIYE